MDAVTHQTQDEFKKEITQLCGLLDQDLDDITQKSIFQFFVYYIFLPKD